MFGCRTIDPLLAAILLENTRSPEPMSALSPNAKTRHDAATQTHQQLPIASSVAQALVQQQHHHHQLPPLKLDDSISNICGGGGVLNEASLRCMSNASTTSAAGSLDDTSALDSILALGLEMEQRAAAAKVEAAAAAAANVPPPTSSLTKTLSSVNVAQPPSQLVGGADDAAIVGRRRCCSSNFTRLFVRRLSLWPKLFNAGAIRALASRKSSSTSSSSSTLRASRAHASQRLRPTSIRIISCTPQPLGTRRLALPRRCHRRHTPIFTR